MERDEKEFQDVCGLNLTMIKYFFQVQICLVQVLFDSFDVVSQNQPFFIICNTHNTIRSSIF